MKIKIAVKILFKVTPLCTAILYHVVFVDSGIINRREVSPGRRLYQKAVRVCNMKIHARGMFSDSQIYKMLKREKRTVSSLIRAR
jgi:hypothetical protein